MLTAMKAHLEQLVSDPNDQFAARIREAIGPREAAATADELRQLVLAMPLVIAKIRLWLEEPAIPKPIKRLHGFLLTYLYHPLDFMPDRAEGLFGYIDDAYLVASIYARTQAHTNYLTRRTPRKVEALGHKVPAWITLAQRAFPKETQQIDRMLDEIEQGRRELFDQLMARHPSGNAHKGA